MKNLEENRKAMLVLFAKQRKKGDKIAVYKYIRRSKHKKEKEQF